MNQQWITQLEKLWDYKWFAFLIPLAFPKIWRALCRSLACLWKLINDQINKLPFMKRIAALEQQNIAVANLHKLWHEENKSALKEISCAVIEIGKNVKRNASGQRDIEDAMKIAKIKFDELFNAVDCTDEFISILNSDKVYNKDKTDILENGYINSIYFSDRQMLREQLEIAKKEKRENTFTLRVMTSVMSFDHFNATIKPFLCVKNDFIGCSLTLKKI